MVEPTTILVANLTEALRQINNYLVLGLVAAVSALILDVWPYHSAGPAEKSTASGKEQAETPRWFLLPGTFVPMAPETAKLVLIGIYFVAGILASFSANSAGDIVRALEDSPKILNAILTYPGIATLPIVWRVIAAILPFLLFLPVILRTCSKLKKLKLVGTGGLIVSLCFGAIPYSLLVLGLVRLKCDG